MTRTTKDRGTDGPFWENGYFFSEINFPFLFRFELNPAAAWIEWGVSGEQTW